MFFSQFTTPGDVDLDETRQFSRVDVTRGDNGPGVNVVYLNRYEQIVITSWSRVIWEQAAVATPGDRLT